MNNNNDDIRQPIPAYRDTLQYNDDDIKPPIPAYRDTLQYNDDDVKPPIPANRDALQYNNNNENNDLEKAIQDSINEYEQQQYDNINDNIFNDILLLSKSEYENKSIEEKFIEDQLNQAMIESMKSYKETEQNKLEAEQNKLLQEELKKQRSDMVLLYIQNLIRINTFQKNDIIDNIIKILNLYIENNIDTYFVDKTTYKNIFSEIKNIRTPSNILELLNKIISINNDIII